MLHCMNGDKLDDGMVARRQRFDFDW